MCFLITVLVAPLFKYPKIKTVFLVSVGMISHFMADVILKHFVGGSRLLFPFSMMRFKLNLIWSNHTLILLVALLFVYLTVVVMKLSLNKKTVSY